MVQRLFVSSSSRLAREAQFVEPRFFVRKTIELDPRGRRKIYSDAYLHRRACTKERDMYYIWGENKPVVDKNIDVGALGETEAVILELGNDGSDQRIAAGFRTTLEIAEPLANFFLERGVLNVRAEDVPNGCPIAPSRTRRSTRLNGKLTGNMLRDRGPTKLSHPPSDCCAGGLECE